jgi:cysteine-rich repeat protein
MIVGSLLFGLAGTANAGTSTVTVFWNGGLAGNPTCGLCAGDWACSAGGAGNWNSGMKTFADPLPPGAIIKQVSATLFSVAGCAGGSSEVEVQLQGATVEQRVLLGGCTCNTCETNSFSSPTVGGWPGYAYGGTETVFVNVVSGVVCADKMDITLTWLDSCGDGVIDAGEECDDSNLSSGDGCNGGCQVETCYSCSGEPSVCAPATDGTSCDDTVFCNGMDTCSSGACTHAGDPCTAGGECQNGCNETLDLCVSTAGESCTEDGNDCTFDQCNGAGSCTHPPKFFLPCDDGLFCNGDDQCLNGSCSLHNGNPCSIDCQQGCDELGATCFASTAGVQCFDDGEFCTNDECNGSGSCVHPPKPLGTVCADDASVCTLDQCDGTGVCNHPPLPNGTSCPSDANPCTLDQCIAGGCAHSPGPDGLSCDDANACTQTDSCQAGACVGTDPVVCPLPLCQAPETCDPSSGECTSCPLGYAQGNGGCQRVYEIDSTQLDNLDSTCGPSRYNGCFGAFGFHWTDTGDLTVGDVIGVDVEFNSGVSCSLSTQRVTLNATSIGEFASEDFCTCPAPTQATRVFPDADPSLYVKGGLNAVSIDATSCEGLANDVGGHFALVTVTYAEPGVATFIRSDCRQAEKSKLKYRNDTTGVNDKLKWKWSKGAATDQVELADPTDATDYQFCVYDEASDDATLLFGATVPASSTLWKEIGTKGFRYKDPAAARGGIAKIVAKGGADGKSKILVRGSGAALSDPTLPLTPNTTGIRVQLTNASNGICWESSFPFGTALVDDDSINAKVP